MLGSHLLAHSIAYLLTALRPTGTNSYCWGCAGSVSLEEWQVGSLLRKPWWASLLDEEKKTISKYFIFASTFAQNKKLLEIALMSAQNLKACQSILPCLWVKGLMSTPIFHWLNSLFCSNVAVPTFLSSYIISKLFVIQLVSSIFQRPAGWLVNNSLGSKKVTVTAVCGVLWQNVRAGFKSVVSGPRKFNLLLQGHYYYTVKKGSTLSEL